jgi:wyosine [tRNA(Phe)-imidazoG37] synthetase (radical SAM superfamily)
VLKEKLLPIITEIPNSEIAGTFSGIKASLGGRPLVLYGAAKLGKLFSDICKVSDIDVAAICDKKAVGDYRKIPIIAPDVLKRDFSDALVLVCSITYNDEICAELKNLGFAPEQIMPYPFNYGYIEHENSLNRYLDGYELEGRTKYYSCVHFERAQLIFSTGIDTETENVMTFCCEPMNDIPGVAFSDSAGKTVENFMRVRKEFIEESKRFGEQAAGNRALTSACAGCANFKLSGWSKTDELIHYITIGMYPAPCQCRCIYCDIKDDPKFMRYNKERHLRYYEKAFDIIEHAQKNNIISHDAMWQVSSGEITIHPLKDRIFNLLKNQFTVFFTNAFIFDEKIAENLTANPNSAIHISIDAGTPETWHKIKGVNNFDAVTKNLAKYQKYSTGVVGGIGGGGGMIKLKYIILPEINDNPNDYFGVTELMKTLKIRHLIISRDLRVKYTTGEEDRVNLIHSAGRLAALLHKNGMSFGIEEYAYSPAEREMIISYANELLSQ